jgi:hypothetical protein
MPIAPVNVHCLLFDQPRGALIAGCADGVVRLHFRDGQVPTGDDLPLPTQLTGEELFRVSFRVPASLADCITRHYPCCARVSVYRRGTTWVFGAAVPPTPAVPRGQAWGALDCPPDQRIYA